MFALWNIWTLNCQETKACNFAHTTFRSRTPLWLTCHLAAYVWYHTTVINGLRVLTRFIAVRSTHFNLFLMFRGLDVPKLHLVNIYNLGGLSDLPCLRCLGNRSFAPKVNSEKGDQQSSHLSF